MDNVENEDGLAYFDPSLLLPSRRHLPFILPLRFFVSQQRVAPDDVLARGPTELGGYTQERLVVKVD
jgi:hypothetical protein